MSPVGSDVEPLLAAASIVQAAATSDTPDHKSLFNVAMSGSSELPAAGPVVAGAFEFVPPPGSLIYQQAAEGSVDFSGDESVLSINLDAGQTLSVAAVPVGGNSLRPEIEILDPSSLSLGLNTAVANGETAFLQTISASTAGTYEIRVRGAAGTTGSFDLQIVLNAAIEGESNGTGANGDFINAESLGASFIDLGAGISRGAVLGRLSLPSGVLVESEPNDDGLVNSASPFDLALANDTTGSFIPIGGNNYRAHFQGTISAGNDLDWDFYRVHAQPGDTLNLFLDGQTLPDAYLWLYDQNGNLLRSNDDGGGNLDSLINYSSFSYSGDYYVVADSFDAYTGTYDLTATLTTLNPPPIVGADDADVYAVELAAGQSLTLTLAGNSANTLGLALYDSSSAQVALSAEVQGSQRIDTFVAPASGVYYARVARGNSTDGQYQLIATKNAEFDSVPNSSQESAQDISGTTGVLGFVREPVLPDASPADMLGGTAHFGASATPNLALQPQAVSQALVAPTSSAVLSPSTSAAASIATASPALNAIPLLSDFTGPTDGRFVPPDPTAAAGPNQIVTMVNSRVAIYDKESGAELFSQDMSGSLGFFGSTGTFSTIFDPHIVYDFESQRFFAVAIDVQSSTVSNLYLAVSKDSTPTSGDDWYKYKLDFTDSTLGLGTGAHFPDYEKVAVSSDAVWISGNYFPIDAGSGVYAGLTAIDKASVLAGGPANILYDEKFSGFSVFPIQSYGSAPTQYFVESPWYGGNSLTIHEISDLLGTPTRTTTTLAVPAFDTPTVVPGLGGSQADAIDARVLTGVWRDGSIWTAHSIRDPAIGDGENVVRWYEIDSTGFPGGSATLLQAGNVDPGPGVHAWMPGINVDAAGNMAVGFAVGGAAMYYGAGYTGRLASDPAGTTVLPVSTLHDGEAYYGSFRWGDYSAVSIDPTDEATFWMFHEYASNFGWRTHVGSFQLAPPEDVDWYRFDVQAGDELELQTATPSDGPFDFANLLDPAIELYDADGNLLDADDNSSADGRNAALKYSVLASGTLFVKVRAVGSQGEYVLHVAGATGGDPAPEVQGTDPLANADLAIYPLTYTLRFTEAIAPGSVDASDLLIGGLPALAVEVISGDTYRFTVDPASEAGDGDYAVVLASGAVTDLQGHANAEFVGGFTLDHTPPHIVATTWNGAALSLDHVISAGAFTFTATLSEDLTSSSSPRRGLRTPAADDVLLYSYTTGSYISATGVSYNPLTKQFSATFGTLPEGSYVLQLLSGDNHFEDLVGNDLDGEAFGPSSDGTPTGDGIAGGNYYAYFSVDSDVRSLDGTWQRVAPNGSLIYSTQVTGIVNSIGDTDSFEFDLEGQQTLTAAAYPQSPSSTLQIQILAPDDSIMASATAAAPGQPVSLQNIAIPVDGRYRVNVVGDEAVSGYSLRLFRNAALETVDNGLAPISIDGSFNSLGSGEYAIVGSSEAGIAYLSSLVWAVQPSSGQILKIDPATGQVLDAFAAPDDLAPSNTHIGLSIAEDGQALLYINSDVDATKLYRLDPVSGAVLSVETTAGFTVDGIGESRTAIGGGVEPDDYAPGFDLTNANPDVVLTSISGTITPVAVGFAMTGSQVFSINGDYGFYEGGNELKATFTASVAVVSIDVGSDDDYDQSVLRAYDINDQLLEEVFSDGLSYGQSQTLTISRPAADIAYIKAYGVNGEVSPLDNLRFGETSGFDKSIFLSHSGSDIHLQQGYSGPEQFFWATGTPVGAIGGDGTGRQFGFFTDGYIHEFSSSADTDSFLSTLPAPAEDIQGLAFDGIWLYASTPSGDLYTLDPDTGAVISSTVIAGGGLYGLGARGLPAPQGTFWFYVDSSSSSVVADVQGGGYQLDEQLPGSLQTSLNGYFLATVNGNSLTIYPANSYLDLNSQPSDFQPGGYPADLAGQLEMLPGLFFSAAFRDVVMSAGGTAALSGSHFAATEIQVPVNDGRLDYRIPGFVEDSESMLGLGGTNLSAGTGIVKQISPGLLQIRFPFASQTSLSSLGLTLDLGLTGEVVANADVGFSPLPFQLGDTDNYTLDLTGKAGHHIDIVLTGSAGADFSQPGTQVMLIGPDGSTVLATSSPSPLGVDALNYDQGLLDFTVPADGVYTVRVRSSTSGQYSLIVTDELAFDTENNNHGAVPLRDLGGFAGAVGFIDARAPETSGAYTLTIDTGATYVDITGELTGDPGAGSFPIVDQLPGSTHITFDGTMLVQLGADTISFPGGSQINALSQLGPFLPGNAPADWAGQVDLGSGFVAYGTIRDFISSLFSSALPLAADGTFSAADVSVDVISGLFAYEIPGVLNDSTTFTGLIGNGSTDFGLYEIVGEQIRVAVPVAGTVELVEPSTGLILTLNLTGQIVGSALLPKPVDQDDDYTLELLAGEQWTVSTDTPLDGLGTQNTLDPSILIIGPDDSVVAFDANSAADGKNARLTFTAPTAGIYRIVVRGEAGQGEYVLHTTQEEPAPKVTGVEVSSTNWSSSFIDYLAATGQGNDGYAIPVGSGVQLDSLPWVNINQIKIAFSEDVQVEAHDLSISGIAVANYGVSNFQYDLGAHVATWTLAQSIPLDSVSLTLTSGGDGVKDLDGNALDGEWDNPVDHDDPSSSHYLSGDGIAGGDFQFIFNVVPGDVDNNSGVNFTDYLKVRSSIGRVAFGDEYLAARDVDGNGGINFADALLTRAQIGSAFASLAMRAASPAASAPAPSAAAAVDSYFANLAAGLAPTPDPATVGLVKSPADGSSDDRSWAARVDGAVHEALSEFAWSLPDVKERVGKLIKLAKR